MIIRLFGKYKHLPIQAKASMWFLICSFLQKGIAFITTPIFTRILTTEEYGVYNVFSSWMGIVTTFITLNLAAGVYTQGLVKFKDERNTFSSSLQGLTLTLCVIWSIVYFTTPTFWNRLFSLSTVQMVAMLITIWTSTVFNFWSTEQRVSLRYKRLVGITILVSIVQPTVAIFAVIHSEDKVTARVLSVAFIQLVVYTGFFFSQMLRGKKFFIKKFWLYAISFNLPLVPHYLSQTVLTSADRIMVDSMVGASEAGIYSLAYSISNIMMLFNAALLQTLNPWIYQKIRDREENDIARIAYAALICIGFLNILLIAFAPEVLKLFAPATYNGALQVIPPVAMSVFFVFSYSLFADFEFYYKKTIFIMMASIAGALLNIVLNYIFIGIFGYVAAGYTTLVCYIIYAVSHYCCMIRVCDEKMGGVRVYDSKKLITISSTFVGIGFLFLFSYRSNLLRFTLVAIICLILITLHKKIYGMFEQIITKNK